MSDIHFDYEMVLFIAVVLTLLAFMFGRHRKIKNSNNKWVRMIAITGSYFPIIFVVLSVRSFAFEPFRIPSSSMMPTLLTGDFIYVNKWSYGIKAPVFHNTLIEVGHPQKGDVFVFRSVEDPSIDVIKRVIGVPGDHVQYDQRTKQVFVNGELVTSKFDGPYEGITDDINPVGLTQRAVSMNNRSFTTLQSNQVHHQYNYTDLIIPEGHYFGMGDNRDFSMDSRMFGLIPEKNVVGKAEFIWMHWRLGDFINGLKRIGNTI